MVRDGYFGFQDYFESLCDKVEGGNDFYLLGHDFQSYLEAQVDLLFNWNSQKSKILVLYNLEWFQESSAYTILNRRLLLIKHLLIKRSGLGWASLALLGLEDLAVIEQLKNMRRRLGESNPANVHSNKKNSQVLCRRHISCGYPTDLLATVLMPWSMPEEEIILAFILDTPSSHTFPAAILTAHILSWSWEEYRMFM